MPKYGRLWLDVCAQEAGNPHSSHQNKKLRCRTDEASACPTSRYLTPKSDWLPALNLPEFAF